MNHRYRLQRLMADLERPLLVTSLTNIRYLTGFTGSNAYLYVQPDRATFLTDGRYGEIAEELLADLDQTVLSVYRRGLYDAIAELFDGSKSVDLEVEHLSWKEKRALAQRFAGDLLPCSGIVESYRSVKDEEEAEALSAAAAAGDRAFSMLTELAERSETELELAENLIEAMMQHGGRRAGWPPIVAMGANAARPHHLSAMDRLEGGLLLLDYGCVVEGYHSDMSRTVSWLPITDEEVNRVYSAVLEANKAGIAAVASGVVAGDIDLAAREVLVTHGYEEYFLHSTGHGVGLDIHEAPSVSKESRDILQVGNVVTIEPGVYLPGRFGVRIEDMVLVTEDGGEVLTKSHRDMLLR